MSDELRMLIVSDNDGASIYSETFSQYNFYATTCSSTSDIRMALQQKEGGLPLAVVLLNSLSMSLSEQIVALISDIQLDSPPHIVIASPISKEIAANYANRQKIVQPAIDALTTKYPSLPIMCFLDLPWNISSIAHSIREFQRGTIKPSKNIILPSTTVRSDNGNCSSIEIIPSTFKKPEPPLKPRMLWIYGVYAYEFTLQTGCNNNLSKTLSAYDFTTSAYEISAFPQCLETEKQQHPISVVTIDKLVLDNCTRIIASIAETYSEKLPHIVIIDPLVVGKYSAEERRTPAQKHLNDIAKQWPGLKVMCILEDSDSKCYTSALINAFYNEDFGYLSVRNTVLFPKADAQNKPLLPNTHDTNFRQCKTKNGDGSHILFTLDNNADYPRTADLVVGNYAKNGIDAYACTRPDIQSCMDQFQESGTSFQAVVIRRPADEKENRSLAEYIKYLLANHKNNPPALILYEYGRKKNGEKSELRGYINDISSASHQHFNGQLMALGISGWGNDASEGLIAQRSKPLILSARMNFALLASYSNIFTFPPNLRSHEEKPRTYRRVISSSHYKHG